jgi:hypothetical protein
MSSDTVKSGWHRFLDKVKQRLGNAAPAMASHHDWKFGKAKVVRLRVGS